MRAFATLDDADIKNKRVLVRVDLNVPVVGGKVTDRTRIERIAPTIIELVDKEAKSFCSPILGARADTIPSSHSSCWPRRLPTS